MQTDDNTTPNSRGCDGPTRPCSLWRRLLVMAYDAVAVVVLMMLTTAVAMLLGFRELNVLEDPLYAFALALTWFLYLAWCWRRGGITLGMRAWRVRLERSDGGRTGWGACGLRFAASLVSAAALGLGFWWSLFDRQRRCWHDILSGTRLLHDAAARKRGRRGNR